MSIKHGVVAAANAFYEATGRDLPEIRIGWLQFVHLKSEIGAGIRADEVYVNGVRVVARDE